MKYTIEFVFDAEDDPPTVEIYDSSGMSVMEIFEEPTLIVPYWSDSFRDWEPGPFAVKVLGLLNAPVPAQRKKPKRDADGRPLLESYRFVGWCEVCGEKQYRVPSGPCCKNGHGGAPTLPADPKEY